MTVSARRDLIAGIDVGGSKIAVLIVDETMAVCARHTIPTDVGTPDDAADHIATALIDTLASSGAALERVAAVGVGVPGRVDPIEGVVSLAVNLGWHQLPLRDRLEARLGLPCAIENDVRAAAAAILERRLLDDVEDFVYLSVGTGISAGVVLDGRLHRGTRGLAGEVGHIVVDPSGSICPCGLRGCLETVAAGPAIARASQAAVDGGRSSILAGRASAITAADVYVAAGQGDALAVEIAERAGLALARAIHALVMTYDVERVVLGGGVTRAGSAFLDPILVGLDDMRASSELAAEMLPAGAVSISPDGPDAGVWGGISVARRLLAGVQFSGSRTGVSTEEVVAREARA